MEQHGYKPENVDVKGGRLIITMDKAPQDPDVTDSD